MFTSSFVVTKNPGFQKPITKHDGDDDRGEHTDDRRPRTASDDFEPFSGSGVPERRADLAVLRAGGRVLPGLPVPSVAGYCWPYWPA